MSVRTLRYYDKVGLLLPSLHTEAGYRLYSDEDLLSLQQILALKFLGFSLEEIKVCLQTEPVRLQEALASQKAMMKEKRSQLDAIIQAIDKAEKLLQTNQCDWEAIMSVIQVMQMEQNKDWVNKYFTPEQQKKMEELSRKSYTEQDAQKLAEWGKGWSEDVSFLLALLFSYSTCQVNCLLYSERPSRCIRCFPALFVHPGANMLAYHLMQWVGFRPVSQADRVHQAVGCA